MKAQTVDFMIDAYKSAIKYYSDYMNRIWNRFNIMLSLDTALVGLWLTFWINNQSILSKNLVVLPILGFIVSTLMYFQSAQDRYVVGRLQHQINKLKDKILEDLDADKEMPVLFYPFDEMALRKKSFVFEGITSWRSRAVSLTRLPVLSSLIFIFLWLTFGTILLQS